jgi:hypothetical protein
VPCNFYEYAVKKEQKENNQQSLVLNNMMP